MRKILGFPKRFFADWRYMSAALCILHLLYFSESELGFGPGLDLVWALAYVLYGLVFLLCSLVRLRLFAPFVGSAVLTIGGCCAFDKATGVPEGTEIEMAEYSRIRLGKYSEWIPVGARDIKFRYYTGLFSAATVRCRVSESDFKWFCWRNRKKIRSDRMDFNELTQEPTSVNHCPWQPGAGRFYAHVSEYRTMGGWFIFYNRDTREMSLRFSTN